MKRCSVERCKGKPINFRYCSSHRHKLLVRTNPSRYLSYKYAVMKSRQAGKDPRSIRSSTGKPIMSRDEFLNWGLNSLDFLRLHKEWALSNFNRRLAPSVDRLNEDKGYTLDNVRWITTGQNSSMPRQLPRRKKAKTFSAEQKSIYELLGVTNEKN